MKRLMGIFLAAGLFFSATPARAELYGYGYGYGSSAGYVDPSWGGLYGAGGYSTYGLGSSLYDLSSYLNTSSLYGSLWGGACSSLLGCGSSTDYASLFYGSSYYLPLSINLSIDLSGLMGSFYGNQKPCCGGYNPYCTQGCGSYTLGCNNGMGSWQTMPNPYSNTCTGYNPTGCMANCLPSTPTYPPIVPLPTNPFPGNPPTVQQWPQPPVLPPWGGCGGVSQCPTGPVVPPVPPTYSYQPTTTPVDPVIYNIPRTGSMVHGN
jgi:hypothetical protein